MEKNDDEGKNLIKSPYISSVIWHEINFKQTLPRNTCIKSWIT